MILTKEDEAAPTAENGCGQSQLPYSQHETDKYFLQLAYSHYETDHVFLGIDTFDRKLIILTKMIICVEHLEGPILMIIIRNPIIENRQCIVKIDN